MKLPWLMPGDPFPDVAHAWDMSDPAPGLLAAGGSLDIETLLQAYGHGIFPWFSEGQPILWWSPDPRMVLKTHHFRLHRSLRKTLEHFRKNVHCAIRIDHAFGHVIRACATAPRAKQNGTWILPHMVQAYEDLHQAGYAHSVETWVNGTLVGGLYCVAVGKAVFGESMFAHTTDASKIALAALVALCRQQGVEWIDCQQNTAHLASLGAAEITRQDFVQHLPQQRAAAPISWRFDPLYWNTLLAAPAKNA